MSITSYSHQSTAGKVIYKQIRKDVGEIFRKLCSEMKVEIIEAEAYTDHIHILVSIPPHLSVAQFFVRLTIKSQALKWGILEYDLPDKAAWQLERPLGRAERVGKNKQAIAEHIRNQLIEDEMMDQMAIKECVDLFTGDKNKKV